MAERPQRICAVALLPSNSISLCIIAEPAASGTLKTKAAAEMTHSQSLGTGGSRAFFGGGGGEGDHVYPNSSSREGPASVLAPAFPPGDHPSHHPLGLLVQGGDKELIMYPLYAKELCVHCVCHLQNSSFSIYHGGLRGPERKTFTVRV